MNGLAAAEGASTLSWDKAFHSKKGLNLMAAAATNLNEIINFLHLSSNIRLCVQCPSFSCTNFAARLRDKKTLRLCYDYQVSIKFLFPDKVGKCVPE